MSDLPGTADQAHANAHAEQWDAHLASEFQLKSTETALATMTANPLVNIVPLMIGAHGREALRDFYSNHFLNQIPDDMAIIPVSRTIGQERLVEEGVLKFTHSVQMDWLLPGIAPTGKPIELAMVVIVQFEEGKIAHEHLYWDQATLLRQAGLLDDPALPILGAEHARQVIAPTLPMNALLRRAEKLAEKTP